MTTEPRRADTDRPPPRYAVIANQLQVAIEGGAYPTGRLPSQEDLERRFGVSSPTIRSALNELRNRGVIETRPGSGSYVRRRDLITIHVTRTEDLTRRRAIAAITGVDSWSSDILEAGHEPDQRFECLNFAADDRVAAILGHNPTDPTRPLVQVGDTVVVRRCWRTVNGVPASIETSYFPRWLVDQLPRLAEPHDIAEGTTLWVSENGHPMVWHDDTVNARGLTRDESVFFGEAPNLGALVRVRLSYGPCGRVLRIMDSTYRSDMYQLRFGIPGDGNQEGPCHDQ